MEVPTILGVIRLITMGGNGIPNPFDISLHVGNDIQLLRKFFDYFLIILFPLILLRIPFFLSKQNKKDQRQAQCGPNTIGSRSLQKNLLHDCTPPFPDT